MKSVSNCVNSTKPKISQSNAEKIREVPALNTDNINRNAILIAIIQNPGIRYRELLRLTDLSNGVLAYHLKKIENSKSIYVLRQHKKTTRYYSDNIPIEEILIIGQIRHSTTRRRILTFILKHKVCTFNSIVEHTNKAPSTVFWHLKALLEAKILFVQESEGNKYLLYQLNSIRFIGNMLSKYSNNNDKPRIDKFEVSNVRADEILAGKVP